MKKVLLIDSGSGGVNVLVECVRVAPFFDYLLFCDNANLPYGDKTGKQLFEITRNNLKKIYKYFKFEIVVFACNTLTAICVEQCRKEFSDIVFIGTEPAIKPALAKYKEDEILLLATEGTIKNCKLLKKHPNIRKKAMPTLASQIDHNLDELETLKVFVRNELSERKEKAIVLGCTHYVALKNQIQEVLPHCEIFSGENGVARRLRAFSDESYINYQIQLVTSKIDDFRAKLLYYFNKKSEE